MQSPPSTAGLPTSASGLPISSSNGLRGIGDHHLASPPSSSIASPGALSTTTSIGGSRSRRPRSRRDKDRRFTCDQCDKTYTRAEHLTRHQLNHQGSYKYTCRVDPTCNKKFVRGDLLTRHEERHQNRKNKQLHSEEGHSPPPRIAPSPPRSAPSPTNDMNQMNRSITIPMSSPESEGGYDDARSDDVLSSPDDMAVDGGYQYHSPTATRGTGFPMPTYNSPAGTQSFMGQQVLSASPPPAFPPNFAVPQPGFSPPPQLNAVIDTSQQTYGGYTLGPSEPINITNNPHTGFSPPNSFSPPEQGPILSFFTSTGADTMIADMGNQNATDAWMGILDVAAGNISWEVPGTYSEQFGDMPYLMYGGQSADGQNMEARRNSMYYPTGRAVPVGVLLSEDAGLPSAPTVSMEVRNRMITEHLKWSLDDPRVHHYKDHLTPEALSDYVQIYWREFHAQYPVLHRPTTYINQHAHLPLFIQMITIGMALGGNNLAQHLAVLIHDELRWSIWSSRTFQLPAKLWELQTLLLGEIFDKMLCGRKQHEMAHLLHGAILTLMRRGTTLDGFLFREQNEQENMAMDNNQDSELTRQWHNFVEQECTKRVAYLAFIIDSQHAMIFGHSLVLNAQELQLKPPCKEDLWSATSAVEWKRRSQSQKPDEQDELGFIETLKIFINEPQSAKDKVPLDPFGALIILHGLISVAWHFQQKATGSLVTTSAQSRAASPSPKSARDHWKVNIERALIAWKACSTGQFTALPSILKYIRSSLALYRIAHITLHTSILDLQVLAGLSKLMGKQVRKEREVTTQLRMCSTWATGEGALKAVSHAVKLLSETLFSGKDGQDFIASRQFGGQDMTYGHHQRMDYALDGILHGKWCLYLATLTLWAWGVVGPQSLAQEGPSSMNGMSSFSSSGIKMEEYDTLFPQFQEADQLTAWKHAQNYVTVMQQSVQERNSGFNLTGLISCPARAETRGLVVTIRNLLRNERWELLREGANLCNKILTEQHRGLSIDSDDIQNLWDERRRLSLIGAGAY